MRSLKTAAAPKADPAPSRWAWRLQRLMLTPGFGADARWRALCPDFGGRALRFSTNRQRQQSIAR